jgi:hypothetical protein
VEGKKRQEEKLSNDGEMEAGICRWKGGKREK